MRLADSRVGVKVRGRPREGLDVDTPFCGVKIEGSESALLAESLSGVDIGVASVVAGTRVAFGVFVLHGGTEGIENRLRCEVFRGDEVDLVFLAEFLLESAEAVQQSTHQAERLLTHVLENLVDLRIGLLEVSLKQLHS